ncbi:MAG: cupin domain-containing protein [Steroidobacteraceae bacterium]
MNALVTKRLWWSVASGVVLGGLVLGGSALYAAGEKAGGHERPLFTAKLPNVPGKSLTAVVVNYAPGGKSPKHVHAGSVFAYVLSGSIRSENSATGPAKVYATGEAFFEPPGSVHLVSENGSSTEPASLLAIFVADDGEQLTKPQK